MCLCVSSEQICSNYWVYYLLSFSGYFLLSSLLTYSLFYLNVQIVCCAGEVFLLLGSFEPGCHMLCDLSHMAYCKLFIVVLYVRCHEMYVWNAALTAKLYSCVHAALTAKLWKFLNNIYGQNCIPVYCTSKGYNQLMMLLWNCLFYFK